MKILTSWLASLVAVGLMVQSVPPALAAHPDLATITAGMLTFYAVAEIESPTDGQNVGSPHTFVNNPTTPEVDRNHKVKITGPANTGNINIDYKLEFFTSGTSFGLTQATNVLVGLDGSGLWVANPVHSQSASVSAGNHVVYAYSYVKFRAGSGTVADITHLHTFTH